MSPPELEQRVLRNAFLVFVLASLGFWLVNGLSAAEDWRRAGEAGGWVRALMLEGTSTLVIVALFPPVAWLERRVPAAPAHWRAALPAHLAASVVFSLIHVAAMMALRFALWPVLFDAAYTAFDAPLADLLYEYRKDALTYGLMIGLIVLVREREVARERLAAAHEDARADRVVTLRCGGRELRLPAAEILSASAAGNYVEVRTRSGERLARTTLSGLEAMLAEAGADPVRLHRSHIAARAALREIVPTADGDAQAHLEDGSVLPVSRRFRRVL